MKTNVKYEKIEDLYTKCIENFWHLVAHKIDFPSNNSYKCLTLGKYDLFIYKSKGEIKAFLNVCPHRGSKIFTNESGKGAISCPYHGWTFTPKKTFVPRLETFKQSPDPQKSRLINWQVEVRGEFIFIAKDPFFSLDEQLGEEVLNILNSVGSSIKKCESIQYLTYKSNWLISVENALEPYHLSVIHPDSLNELLLEDGTDKIWDWASLWNAPSKNKRISNISKRLKKNIRTSIDINGYWTLFLFPFVQISSTEGLSFAIQTFDPCTESDIEKTNFKTTLYSPNFSNNVLENSLISFYDSVTKLNYKVFKEDSEICSKVPLSTWDFSPLEYTSKLEIKVDHFKKCCREIIYFKK